MAADRPRPVSSRELEREVSREVAQIRAESPVILPQGRCRVCQHPESRTKVNTLLGYGMGESEILRYIEDLNEKRSKNNQITKDSIRNHKQRHFAVQAESAAGYRRILERRKAQLSDEHTEAVSSLLTGMAYLDVVAQKGWQTLIKDETVVPYGDGLQAQLRLEEMVREGAIEEQVAQMRRDVGLLQQAVTDVAAQYPGLEDAILERIGELTGASVRRTSDTDDNITDVEVVDGDYYDRDDDDEGFSPVMEADDGDSFED